MSRSNPQENAVQNPAVRWFEWNGEHGMIRYYDKTDKKNVEVGADFQFMLLDQLGSVRGWHDASESGIYSNEVKDTRQDRLVVKAFKGGTIAEGLYKDIKDKVNAAGGQFVANCYIAFKNGGDGLAIGSLRLKGAALSAWMDFTKERRADLYTKAIRIHGFNEGKKGRIVYRTPIFSLVDVTAASNAAATALDVIFQEFLKSYLKRNTRDQVDTHLRDEDVLNEPTTQDHQRDAVDDDSIPF